ncbi:MAG: HAD hydrolase family protein [Thermodesulfobacteriota bacterium]|nr:HAD hydrolase family protein [Thermodesulfobacteriota bacterium]
MIEINIPGREAVIVKNILLDLNGTMSIDGEIIEGVKGRLQRLSERVDLHIVTADTGGQAEKTIEKLKGDSRSEGKYLEISLHVIEKGEEDFQKLELVQVLRSHETVCIGNGSNDTLMLKESCIGICVLGKEGAATEAIMSADVVTSHIKDALDLLLMPKRLIATLRK